MLDVRGLVVRYGAATALDGVDLEVPAHAMVALIGANGAGKTTLLNAVCGLVQVAAGSCRLAGRVAQVPEGRQLFGGMSVADNLALGAWGLRDRDPAPVYRLFPPLREMRGRRAETLSGGEQQMVAVGRALMGRPDLLAVDELSLGLAPRVVDSLSDHLVALNRELGTAILLVEQNARLALALCPYTYVLEAGRVSAHGPSAELRESDSVRAAYLGGVV